MQPSTEIRNPTDDRTKEQQRKDGKDRQVRQGLRSEEVEAAIELARAAGVSEALLERMGGYTGCVGVLDTGRPGPVTTLRFDIDCLAIEETKDENHLPNREGFASTRPGLSHACGHDGHTAVGLGVAQWLADDKETLCGKVKLVF